MVPGLTPDGPMVFMPAGGFDDDPGLRPEAHLFVDSKAVWYEIPDDGLERHATFPGGSGEPEVAPRPGAPPPSGPGVVRGICLCGGVAFEGGPPRGLVYCLEQCVAYPRGCASSHEWVARQR